MIETTSAAKKYLSCISGNVKGTRSNETNDTLTIMSLSNETVLRQQNRQSTHTSNPARIKPGFSNSPGLLGSHWYKFGPSQAKSPLAHDCQFEPPFCPQLFIPRCCQFDTLWDTPGKRWVW